MHFAQNIINGLLLGGLYVCIAIGFSLIWGVLNIINFLHGSLIVLGSYIAFYAFTYLGISPFLAPIFVMPMMFAFGYGLQRAVLQLAIEKAGSIDGEKVRDVLASTEFQTFYGPIKFGPSGQNITADNPIFQIQDKKIVIIAPASVKAGDLQLMK